VSGIANAATVRPTNRTSAKKTATTTTTQQTNTDSGTNTVKKKKANQAETVADEEIEPAIIENKASMFDDAIGSDLGFGDSVSGDSELAEQIRKQRASAEARDKLNLVSSNQKSGLKNGKNACDDALRQCVQKTCGNDFTKCALDSDTLFGEKLNRCRRDTTCTGEEFKLFTTEIKADRDFNAQMASYQSVIDCGNKYNSCIQNECGATFGKCLGKTAADKAVNNCATIAKNCMEQDSGLSARVGSVIARLREDGEKDVKADEERMYKLRDLMASQCTKLGAMFDERSFDCVYTVNFFAGEDQSNPMASRKRYAGDTFVCTQEWFGTNVTMYKENAYRETRAQTAASSAMLGSGVGTAVGLVTSGAIGRALDTQKAKKDLKKECKSQGMKLKDGECVPDEKAEKNKTNVQRLLNGDDEETGQTETIDPTDNGAKGVPAKNNGVLGGSATGDGEKKGETLIKNPFTVERNKDGTIKSEFDKKLDKITNGGKLTTGDLPKGDPKTSLGMGLTINSADNTLKNVGKKFGLDTSGIGSGGAGSKSGSTGGDSGGGKGGSTSGTGKGDGDGALKTAAKKTGQAVGNAAKTVGKTVANAFRKKENRK